MTWKDLDINLTKQHDGDVLVDEDVDAIINSIINIWKTIQGSRRMIPSFAMPSHNILFNQLDDETLDQLEYMLLQAIEIWEDRIFINQFKLEPDYDNNTIECKLEFRLKHDFEDRTYNVNETFVLQG